MSVEFSYMRVLPNSAFADQKGRKFPIFDKSHVLSAMLCLMNDIDEGFEKSGHDEYYWQNIHDRILARAKYFQMNLRHRNCPLCNMKVQFT